MKESGEMYLENLLILSKQKGEVRAVDIAENMGYSKPSISRALKILREEGYVEVDKNGFITFREKGKVLAEKIYERHQVLSKLLIKIGVDEKTAIADACKIEHDISDKTFNIIKKFTD